MAEEEIIAQFQKYAREEIRVTINEFKNNKYIHFRTYVGFEGEEKKTDAEGHRSESGSLPGAEESDDASREAVARTRPHRRPSGVSAGFSSSDFPPVPRRWRDDRR